MIAALSLSVALLVLNAFFVAAEFALIASKRHRLEDLAERGSRSARAAVNGSKELSLMLAGAQLGITLCTLGLGSVAKPAVADLLASVLTFVRLPDAAASVVAVVLAVTLVVFLHMVVGEMAPKSWAISDPERSAVLLALPFRAFARVARPLLSVLNALANGCLRLLKVLPQNELAQAHGPNELALLIGSAHQGGMLGEPEHRVLSGAIDLGTLTLGEVMVPIDRAVGVDRDATCGEAEERSRATGRSRLVVSKDGRPVELAHVREVVRTDPAAAVGTISSPAATIDTSVTLLGALSTMRAHRAQLVLVTDGAQTVGLVAMEDLLERVLGSFDDETDHR